MRCVSQIESEKSKKFVTKKQAEEAKFEGVRSTAKVALRIEKRWENNELI
jgi:hypothetical protein